MCVFVCLVVCLFVCLFFVCFVGLFVRLRVCVCVSKGLGFQGLGFSGFPKEQGSATGADKVCTRVDGDL